MQCRIWNVIFRKRIIKLMRTVGRSDNALLLFSRIQNFKILQKIQEVANERDCAGGRNRIQTLSDRRTMPSLKINISFAFSMNRKNDRNS
ncbi:hypothetical protein ACH95_13355 [Bacillus glycinifermentans]|nr:hypothetical protein ACH95_13355 [Bacillus glycinifermentans]